MIFKSPKKRGWHSWYSWYPTYVWETDEWIWFKSIYRNWVVWNDPYDNDFFGFWEYSYTLPIVKEYPIRQPQKNRHVFSPASDPTQ